MHRRYLLLRLFNFTLASVAAPALLLAMFCTESVTNTLVFTNINGCILLCEVLFFRWLLDGKVNHQWLAGIAIGLTPGDQTVAGATAVAAAAQPTVAGAGYRLRGAAGVQRGGWSLVSDPMNFVRRTVPYIFTTRDYFNSSIQGNGIYYGLPMWLILLLRIIFGLLAVASLWLLYRYYRDRDPLFWMADVLGCAADRLVPGAVVGSGLLLDDVVPVPDDGGAAELGDPQLAGVAGDLRVHDDGPLALGHWPTTGRFLEYMKVTYGWSLMLIVVFCVLYFRYLDAKDDGRLADGINPP